jgi:hypothetical protein
VKFIITIAVESVKNVTKRLSMRLKPLIRSKKQWPASTLGTAVPWGSSVAAARRDGGR